MRVPQPADSTGWHWRQRQALDNRVPRRQRAVGKLMGDERTNGGVRSIHRRLRELRGIYDLGRRRAASG